MRKAFVGSWVQMRLYIRSGRIVFPLLPLIAYPMIFYHGLPVDAVSSFLLSTVAAFAWGAWITLAMSWSEDATLRHILMVKAGKGRYYLALEAWQFLFGAAGGVFLVGVPMLMRGIYLPGMFVREPSFLAVLLGMLLNVCAAVCGASVGGLFHPNILQERKLAYMLCLMMGVLGLVGGMAGVPLALRLLLPPLYDSINHLGRSAALESRETLPYCLWYLLYAGAAAGLRHILLAKAREH